MEILQEHPEVWEEIQAIRAEYETLREQKGRMAFNRPMQRQMRNRFQATDRCDRFPRWTEEDSNEDFQNFPQNFPHQGRKWFR